MARERESRTATGWRVPIWLLAAVLVVAGIAAYATSFSGVFIGDDVDAIVLNQNLKSLSPIGKAMTAPADTTLAGRPIATLSFAINYAMAPSGSRDVMEPRPGAGPDDPFYNNVWGYHATNLLIHVLAGLALFGIVRRSLLVPALRDRFGGASTSLAFGVALLWLVHPLHTDSVTFLVQRVESLMGLFVLATLYCSIRAAETEFKSAGWIAAAVAACALGMGTKEVTFAAPILVGAWIFLFRPDVRLWESPRWLMLGLASTWIILAVLLLTQNSRSLSVGFGLGGWTWWSYLRTQAGVIVHYLWLVFWPRPLVFHYAWLPVGSWLEVLPQIVLLAALGLATLWAFVRRRPVAFCGVWFFLILAPSSSILPIASEVAAEHRMYLPLAAVMSTLVIGGYAAVEYFAGSAGAAPKLRKQLAPIVWLGVAAIAVVLAWQTSSRNLVYASVETMTEDNVIGRPDNASAQLLYGVQLFRRRQFPQAEASLRKALDLPLPPGSDSQPRMMMHLYLGAALSSQRKFDEGLPHLREASAMSPDLMDAYGFIAEAQLSQGKARDAVATLEQALAKKPEAVPQLVRLAWILSTSSDDTVRNGARAVELSERAVRLTNAGDLSALDILSAGYAEMGQFDRAIETIGRAKTLDGQLGGSPLTPVLDGHLQMYQAKRPIRTIGW